MTAYTGYLTRSAHFSIAGDVAPGVNADHTHPAPEPDIFDPQPTPPAQQAGDVWQPAENGFASGDHVQPIEHWYAGELAVPSNVPYGTAQQAMQERMIQDHSAVNYRRDTVRLYQHATEGETIDWVVGRTAQESGESLPTSVQYLANGTNAFDQTNQPNEVYGGDAANVGRYRLGYDVNYFGEYKYPIGKFGLDTMLRAYTGLTPIVPAEKTQLNQDAAPYTPNSSGTATWINGQYQVPSLFALPSETDMTDYTTASSQSYETSNGFNEGERL